MKRKNMMVMNMDIIKNPLNRVEAVITLEDKIETVKFMNNTDTVILCQLDMKQAGYKRA